MATKAKRPFAVDVSATASCGCGWIARNVRGGVILAMQHSDETKHTCFVTTEVRPKHSRHAAPLYSRSAMRKNWRLGERGPKAC